MILLYYQQLFCHQGNQQLPCTLSVCCQCYHLDCSLFAYLQTSIEAEGFRSLREGEEVEFDVEEGPDGRAKAIKVTGPGGVAPQVMIIDSPASIYVRYFYMCHIVATHMFAMYSRAGGRVAGETVGCWVVCHKQAAAVGSSNSAGSQLWSSAIAYVLRWAGGSHVSQSSLGGV